MSGEETKDYRDLLYEEKLDRINEKLDDIKDFIAQKASSTSVQRLEDRVRVIEQSHIPCASVTLVMHEVAEMKKNIVPREEFNKLVEDFKPIKDATEGNVYFTKHPGQFKMLIAGSIFLLIISALGIVPSMVVWQRYSMDMKDRQKKELIESTKDKSLNDTSKK